jgi:hypothetical protein
MEVVALIVVLSGLSNWAVWHMLRERLSITVPFVIADVPDVSLDWRGLV